MTKNLNSDPILVHLVQIRGTKFFFKNLTFSVTRYHGQLSPCTTSEKTNDPVTEGKTDGQADESDFIGRCLTNFERPTTSESKRADKGE